MKIYLIESVNRKTYRRRYLENMKWVRRSVIPGLIIFTLILIIPNIYKLRAEKQERGKENEELLQNLYTNNKLEKGCQKEENKIICYSTTLSQIKDFFNLHLQETDQHLKLYISGCRDKVLKKGWMSEKYYLEEIHIFYSDFNQIELEAFNSNAFAQTSFLEIRNGKIIEFSNLTFRGLNSLQKLHIYNENTYLADNLLGSLSQNLEYFKFEGKDNFVANDPKNLLADNKFDFPNLITIEFRINNFGTFINSMTFKNVRALKSLYAIKSKIIAIDALAFSANTNLEHLDLSGNMLKSISSNLFKPISMLKHFRINLNENNFICDCNLTYLIRFYKTYYDNFVQKLNCVASESIGAIEINKINLSCDTVTPCICPDPEHDGTTTATSVTISTTKSPTHPYNLVNVTCDDKTCQDCSDNPPYLKIKEADVSFSLTTISNTQVRVILDHLIENLDILWFNSTITGQMKIDNKYFKSRVDSAAAISYENGFGTGCGLGLGEDVTINGLTENSSYVFCLIKRNDTEISPFNCQSHYLKYVGQHEADVCDLNTLTFALIITGVIFSGVFGAVLMFYIIKHKPTLLKGSPRVVIINKGSKSVMLIPKPKRKISDEERSKKTSSQNSQFSNLSFDTSVLSEKNQQRRLSDSSITTNRSYVIPNLYETVQYQRRMEMNQTEICFEKLPCTPPPPLPKRKSKHIDDSKEIYTSPIRRRDCRY